MSMPRFLSFSYPEKSVGETDKLEGISRRNKKFLAYLVAIWYIHWNNWDSLPKLHSIQGEITHEFGRHFP